MVMLGRLIERSILIPDPMVVKANAIVHIRRVFYINLGRSGIYAVHKWIIAVGHSRSDFSIWRVLESLLFGNSLLSRVIIRIQLGQIESKTEYQSVSDSPPERRTFRFVR
jgi:hypothetical protein